MAEEKSTDAAARLQPGLSCPKCRTQQVSALRPNGISPNPGYHCLSCGTRMRGMTGTYVVVALLGVGLLSVAAGALAPFKNHLAEESIRQLVSAPMGPGSQFFAIPLYLFLVGYSIRELLRPRPRRA